MFEFWNAFTHSADFFVMTLVTVFCFIAVAFALLRRTK
jgi:cbb3-type cytochrome oxidase subunit 3